MKLRADAIYALFNVPRPLRIGDRVQHTLTNLRGSIVGFQRYGNFITCRFNKHLTVQLDNGRLVPGLHPREFVLAPARSRYVDNCGGIVAYRQSL